MPPRVYIGANLAMLARARELAALVRSAGFEVVSSWHDTTPDGTRDPNEEGTRAKLALICHEEVARCDIFVAYLAEGAPRGTLVELGMALGFGKRAVVVQGEATARMIFDSHPRVCRLVDRLEHLPELLRRVSTVIDWERGHQLARAAGDREIG